MLISKLEIIVNLKNLYKKRRLHRVQAGERDIPFHACWCSPKPLVQIFLKFVKRLRRGFSFFWNVVFIILYLVLTIKNKAIFNKIFD